MVLNIVILVSILLFIFLFCLFLWKSNVELKKERNRTSLYIAFSKENDLFFLIKRILKDLSEEILMREIEKTESDDSNVPNKHFVLRRKTGEKEKVVLDKKTALFLKHLIELHHTSKKIELLIKNGDKDSISYLENELSDVSLVLIEVGKSLRKGVPFTNQYIQNSVINVTKDIQGILDKYYEFSTENISHEMRIYKELKNKRQKENFDI